MKPFALAVSCLALVAAGCGVTEPPAPPSMSTSFQEDIHLTSSSRVAIRHLTFEVAPPKRSLHASLNVWAIRIGTDTTQEFQKGLTLSVVPDDVAGSLAFPAE